MEHNYNDEEYFISFILQFLVELIILLYFRFGLLASPSFIFNMISFSNATT